MLRLLILLVGMLTTRRPGGTREPPRDAGPRYRDQREHGAWERRAREDAAWEDAASEGDPWEEDPWEDDRWEGDTWYLPPQSPPPAARPRSEPRTLAQRPPRQVIRGQLVGPPRRRRRIPLKLKWAAALILAGLIFRKAIAWAVLAALSAALHLVGLNVRLPHISFGWPWQSVTAGTTTDVSVDASATVDLNPGPAWWAPGTGHYQLQVLSRPATGTPGRVSVAIVLPSPRLPQTVHDVTVDNTMSHPIDTQHSWTYPGLGCGALIRPQFSVSVLYAQAQNLAFAQARNNPRITGPLIKAAEAQAALIIRNNFVQPTVNALGYTLAGFAIHWSAAS